MIKITRTITLDGSSAEDYQKIILHLSETNSEEQGWYILKEPLVNRVTAIKKEEIDSI